MAAQLLGNLIDFHNNKRVALSAVERAGFQGEYPYYGAQSIVDHVAGYRFNGEFLLVAEDGENLRSRKAPIASIVQGKFWVNNHAHVLTARPGIADLKFLEALLNWLDIAAYVTGAAQPKLSMGNLRNIEVTVPDYKTQARLGQILGDISELVASLQKQTSLLEKAARLIYSEWFVRQSLPHSANWAPATLEEVIGINPKTPCEAGKEAPFVPMTALSQTGMVIEGIEQRSIGGGAKFQNGDTLLARITPCLENGKTGFVQFLDDENPVASGSTEFIVLRSRRVNPYWVYCLARTEHFREFAIRSMSGADGRQRVSTNSLAQYPVTIPPAEILEDFEQAVGPMFVQIHTLTKQIAQLRQARDLLLPRLISGQLRL